MASANAQKAVTGGLGSSTNATADGVEETVDWHAVDAGAVAQKLGVDISKGLSATEAADRLRTNGRNELAGQKKESGLQAFLRQYRDFMQIILLAAAVINLVV